MGIINKMPQGSNKTSSGDIALYNTTGTRDGYLLCDGSTVSSDSYPALQKKLNTDVDVTSTATTTFYSGDSDYYSIQGNKYIQVCENDYGICISGNMAGGRVGYYIKSTGNTSYQRPTSYGSFYKSFCWEWNGSVYAICYQARLLKTTEFTSWTTLSSSLPFYEATGIQWGTWNNKGYVLIKDTNNAYYYSTSDSEFKTWSTTYPSGFSGTEYDAVEKRFVKYSSGTFYVYNPDTNANDSTIGTTSSASGTFLGVACGKYAVFNTGTKLLVIKMSTGELMCTYLRQETKLDVSTDASYTYSYSSAVLRLCGEYVLSYRRATAVWIYPIKEADVEGKLKGKVVSVKKYITCNGNEEYIFGRELIMGYATYARPGYGYLYGIQADITTVDLLLPTLNDTTNNYYGYIKT